ncbi:hypothetical protein C7C46_12465 [Streptomyces tateyamensis]|uniref:Bacterial Ig-like domain-containing protein n=1 Tax=Streptomyces tateyamensis TaxID=565073 RepID=A0A2V4N7T5_9ACTN|nr:hypothetical protein C7C46_12465 [Streptomyces tateyamensis]
MVAAALAAGLTFGWLPTVSQAQQSPDSWTADRHAVLRSGLTVDLGFAPAPGVSVQAASGKLGDGGYADGLHSGAPAESFRAVQSRPQADGTWRTMGTLQLTFSRPVRNPRLHVSGLAGGSGGSGGSGGPGAALRLSVTGGTPAGPVLTARTPWKGWTVADGTLGPTAQDGSTDATVDRSGSVELDGTFDTATLRVERRDTMPAGSTAAVPVLDQAFTVSLDEALGSAPAGYGNASHVISDLFLGSDAVSPVPTAGLAHRTGAGTPLPAPPEIQPGRVEHTANDPTLDFPKDAAIGRFYDLTVPVSPGQSPATLAGWIDFRRDGTFDAAERAQVDINPGAGSATLEWIVPPDVAAGQTWARLRIARDPAQVVSPNGFADAGEVEDQLVDLQVGAAKPEISSPVPGSSVGDPKPQFSGDSGVSGATVSVQEGGVTLCQANVGRDGAWSCGAGQALPQGDHTVRPSETTSGGLTLQGDPVRFTVTTTPPAPPVFTVPEYTNDPGLLLTGTGAPGSTVTVTEAASELCRTAVRADRSWSCLPVEELAEGSHLLTATAADPAGNRTAGKPVTLIVRTVPPAKPVLTVPGPGEQLHLLRPRLAGRGDPGSSVTVVAGGDGALCSAVVAVDGSWTCNAQRDLAAGEQLLTPTAVDRAGNVAQGEAVRVVVAGGVSPSATGGVSPAPTGGASPSATGGASPAPTGGASPSSSGSASPAGVASPSATGVASPAEGASPSPAGVVNPGASGSASPTGVASPPPTGAAGPSATGVASADPPVPVLEDAPVPIRVPTVRAIYALQKSAPATFPSSDPGSNTASSPASPGHTTPPDEPAGASSSQALAPPPGDPAAGRPGDLGGWRAVTCGVFLILTGLTLVTRRVLAQGHGSRRRPR